MRHRFAVAEAFKRWAIVDGRREHVGMEYVVIATFQNLEDAILLCDVLLLKGREVKVTGN